MTVISLNAYREKKRITNWEEYYFELKTKTFLVVVEEFDPEEHVYVADICLRSNDDVLCITSCLGETPRQALREAVNRARIVLTAKPYIRNI